MRHPFVTELVRSIGTSWTRFFAIMCIVGLGVGFYAGLGMTGYDMRLAAERYYDGTHLYDLRVISTLGLTEDQVDIIRQLDGVESAVGDYAADVLISLEGKTYPTRTTSFDVAAARAGTVDKHGFAVDSEDDTYLNRLVLTEGDWPSNPNECLLSADFVMGEPIKLGDTVEILSGTSSIDDVFAVRTFTVSGVVHSSVNPSSTSVSYTKLGSGLLKQSMYLLPEAFSDGLPFTEVYVCVEGARDLNSTRDEYQQRVDEVAKDIEELGLGALRLEQIRSDAESQLADAEAEYNAGKEEAEAGFSDAEAQLESARQQLEEGEAAYENGLREYEEGQAQLAAGTAELERRLAEARALLEQKSRELADGEKQLGMTQADIDAARALLDEKAQELADGEKQLGMTQADIDSARAQIAAKEQELADGEKQLGMTQADIDAARAELAARSAEWEAQQAKLQQVCDILTSVKSLLNEVSDTINQEGPLTREQLIALRDQTRATIESNVRTAASLLEGMTIDDVKLIAARDEVKALAQEVNVALGDIDLDDEPAVTRAKLISILSHPISSTNTAIDVVLARIGEWMQSANDAIEDARSKLDQAQAARDALDAGYAAIADAKDKLDQAQAARDALDAGYAALADARNKLDQAQWARNALDDGARQIAEGWNQYYAQEASARAQLFDAQQVLNAAAQRLIDAALQLAEGRKEYEEGLATYYDTRAEIESRLADAAAQLEAARKEISKLKEPSIYVLDRNTNVGLMAQRSDTYRIDAIATVFPIIFFLVAALVSLTTMTRMVEDERIDIGTHKALGFTTPRITAKYVAYAGIAGLTGSAVLIAILTQLLPSVVQSAYTVAYNVPNLPLPLPIDIGKTLIAVSIGLGVTFLAIYGAAAATLREVPAALLQPRAPKAGKRILLERIGFIWSRLSFSWKVTFRNLFRYKQRLAMTVVGVTGCTALLLTGFGLHDAIWDIIDYQFEGSNPVQRYNMSVGLDSSTTAADIDTIKQQLVTSGGADGFALVDRENMLISSGDKNDASVLILFVVPDSDSFTEMIDLRERRSGEGIPFDASSVVLTEKQAQILGVGVGDTVTIFDQDEIGNATGTGYKLTLTGISENYAFNYLYVGSSAWNASTGRVCNTDTLLARARTDHDSIAAMAEALDHDDNITNVNFNTETIDTYRTTLQAINMIVVVLVAAAGTLAFIVLYNLTNIQLIERVREIASLKVLGFNRQEVASYLFRETFILVVMGSMVGLVAGVFLEKYVIKTAEVDTVMWVRDIHPSSFLLAFGLTLVFSIIVMLIIAPKLRKIDMVESLKSVD